MLYYTNYTKYRIFYLSLGILYQQIYQSCNVFIMECTAYTSVSRAMTGPSSRSPITIWISGLISAVYYRRTEHTIILLGLHCYSNSVYNDSRMLQFLVFLKISTINASSILPWTVASLVLSIISPASFVWHPRQLSYEIILGKFTG